MVVFGNKKFRYLTHSNFESALLGANLITKEAKGWNPIVAKEGILFNLSRIEWVEIRALVHFVIFVEAAVRDKISVKIALPLTRATKREEALVQSCVVADADKIIRRKVEKREKALAFMEYLGFFNALKLPHLQGSAKLISLVYDLDPFDEGVVRLKLNIPTEEAKDSITSDSLIDVSEPLYEKIFPLKWVSISDPSSIEPILSFFTHVITSDNNPGLEGVDARTISNVILKELVENVQRHANTTQWALVAAHAAKRTISKAYIEEYCSHFREVERPYIEWQSKVGGGWLEIIVGDSGVGIPATLGEAYYNKSLSGKAPKDNSLDTAAIIKWSFDRWSSKDKTTFERGTRGLYRLDRVARKYHGLVSIRSGNAMAGWDHGGTGYHQSIVDPKPLRLIPGTICYYRSLTALHQPVIWRGLGGAENKVRFEIVSMGALTDNGIDENALEKLRNLVVSSSRSESLCIIASVDSMRSSEEGVGKALQQLTEIRHPPALVVHGLPGDWLSIENKVDSINRVFQASHHGEESHKPDHYLIWDPILVLGENVETQWAWAGVGEDQNWLLKALMSSENGVIKADIIGKHFTNDEHRR
ncbi:MAG: hypothetical protein OEV89_12270, partial [Desulfobulbaceae bacterium]|nr:hypothetical protein [Desulfobulbaceae bacterium]HIJ91437.1 hypothetical protein [Deltaproteobacteria bacterium]